MNHREQSTALQPDLNGPATSSLTPDSAQPGRPEDDRLLRGKGLYIGDHFAPDMLHVAFVRSPHAHARIGAIDAAPALALDGVVGVYTGQDWPEAFMPAPNPLIEAARVPAMPVLTRERVEFLGQPVAVVVARSAAQARAAADEVFVDYESLDLADEPETIASTGWQQSRGQTQGSTSSSAQAPLQDGAAATYRVSFEHEQSRCAPFAMESRGCVMRWNRQTQRLTAWLATQAPARGRDDLAATLGVPAQQVRVILGDFGGAFGGKASLYPEDHVCALLARTLDATLSWCSTRSEDLLAASHGRGSSLAGSLSADEHGRLTHLQARLRFPLGAWLPYSALVPVRNGCRILPGVYRLAAGDVDGRAYRSNHAPVNIYRGAGRPEAALVMEVLMDKLARASGIDPIELRRRNLWPADELPATLPGGDRLDSSDFARLLDAACERFDYAGERERQRAERARGELVGIGCALYAEPCGQGFESARVSRLADGRYEVASGSCSQGQGHSVTFARIAAAALGVDESQVSVIEGDTDRVPDGIGALASRSTAIGGSAVLLAARELARRLGLPSAVERSAAGLDAANAASGKQTFIEPTAGGAHEESVAIRYEAPHEAWASGCVLVRLRIDAQTGEPRIERLVWADDAGEVIAPVLLKGQLLGGLAQGIGQALMERLVYDDQGQLLTGSLMDYAVPRADDIPAVELVSVPTRSSANALGAKGVGEAGCIGVPAAILNAALDALAPLGVQNLNFPLTASQLWTAMQPTTDD